MEVGYPRGRESAGCDESQREPEMTGDHRAQDRTYGHAAAGGEHEDQPLVQLAADVRQYGNSAPMAANTPAWG